MFGRKIKLIIKDDSYNPTNTVNVVHQEVLQSKVFGIFEGLGTPTHTKVVGYLNASKAPDIFVASGCPYWEDGTKQSYTFGWQPNYTIEGKILGQYIKKHFAGQKVGVLYQDDDFGQGGLKGIKRHTPLGEAAARTLAAQLDEFEERSAALRALADSDDAPSADQLRELHELRIAAKRLRYTLELFEPALPGGAAEAIDDLKHLQDELGFVHDRDVLTDLALEDRRFTAERELAQLSGVAERSMVAIGWSSPAIEVSTTSLSSVRLFPKVK